ncbi:MAG TPA: hypothetical protein VEF33_01010, partial [Syntrophales bacterium]|nr:hypothetical protein [Syntrophales bacterium]
MALRTHSIFDREIISQALIESAKKMNPMHMVKNPVMFVTEVGAFIVTAGLFFMRGGENLGFGLQ